MNSLAKPAFALLLFSLLSLAYADDIPIVKVPDTAVAAFYMADGQTLAQEYLVGVKERRIRGFLVPLSAPTNPYPSPLPTDPVPRSIALPNGATYALYFDMDSRICAIESLAGVTGRDGMDLGPPLGGPPGCPAKCTLIGPNGSYCMPGCH